MKDLQTTKKALGQRIRALRNEKGWSQEMLAAKAEIGDSYVSELENGKHNMRLEKLVQIANAFEVELNELFDFQ